MTAENHPVACGLLSEIWEGLGGEAGVLEQVSFTGQGALPSPFAVTDLAAATIASAGLAVSDLLAATGQRAPEVRVDRMLASGWFHLPAGPSQLLGQPSSSHSASSPWMVDFPTADGRFLRLQATFPTLRQRVAKNLGVEETADSFAREILNHDADVIEQRLVDAGAAVAASRSIDEWRRHPQGLAIAEAPIAELEITDFAPEPLRSWRPADGRPLAGIRVLDMTRVVSGPIATRFLAWCGAEVLRLEAPNSDESLTALGRGNDLGLGKRWAFLDLKTPAGRDRFLELVADADIFMHCHRPGSLEQLGLTPEVLAAAQPGLVQVRLSAYGWSGPWHARRGFDTLVQYSTGICNSVSAWANESPASRLPLNALGRLVDASRPRHLPVEVLDFGTAYQLAAAAVRGLQHRLVTGRGSIARMSLARTARLLTERGQFDLESPSINLPLDGPWEPIVHGSPRGPTRHLRSPLAIDGTPLFWERPYEMAGASTPNWSAPR